MCPLSSLLSGNAKTEQKAIGQAKRNDIYLKKKTKTKTSCMSRVYSTQAMYELTIVCYTLIGVNDRIETMGNLV